MIEVADRGPVDSGEPAVDPARERVEPLVDIGVRANLLPAGLSDLQEKNLLDQIGPTLQQALDRQKAGVEALCVVYAIYRNDHRSEHAGRRSTCEAAFRIGGSGKGGERRGIDADRKDSRGGALAERRYLTAGLGFAARFVFHIGLEGAPPRLTLKADKIIREQRSHQRLVLRQGRQ